MRCWPFSDHTSVCKGQAIFFSLGGEVLIITSVSSFSVFIQKADHTPPRERDLQALITTIVSGRLLNGPKNVCPNQTGP